MRKPGATAANGPSANVRPASSGCGITSLRETKRPPLQARISRSSTRAAHRRPGRRPKASSSALSVESMDTGSRSLSSRATALAKSRPAPPAAGLMTIGEESDKPNRRSSSAMAAATTAGGRPYRPWGRLEPIPMAYRCGTALPVIASPAKQSSRVDCFVTASASMTGV